MEQWFRRVREVLEPLGEVPAFEEALQKGSAAFKKYIRVHPHRFSKNHSQHDIYHDAGMQLGPSYAFAQNSYEVLNFSERFWDSSPLQGANLGFFQEPMATEVVEALELKPGENVLETCAAPGAKTVHILEELQGKGILYSFEIDKLRFGRLDLLSARSGYKNHKLFCEAFDCVDNLPKFQKILCDVPCSSESFFFKRRETRKDISDVEVFKIQKIQRAIVARALEYLSPGGILLYATCTYNRNENEDNRDWILEQDSTLKLRREVRRFPHREGVPGGYFAIFDKAGSPNEKAEDLGVSDLVFRSEYHEAMSKDSKLPILNLNLKDAEKYLRGEAVVGDFKMRGLLRLSWNDFVLGPGKAVEGRINNLLPKGLRALR